MAFIGNVLASDQLVLTRGRDFKWVFENFDENDEPANYPPGELFFELDTGGEHNALQQVSVTAASGGTFKLGVWDAAEGEYKFTAPIDYYDATENPAGQDGDITDALEALPNVGAGNVLVQPVSYVPVWELNFTINAPINEVQRIEFTGNPTGGVFKLSLGLYVTGNIPFGSSAAFVQSELEGLGSIGTGNVKVTSVTNGYQVEFIGSKSGTDMEQLVGWHGWFGISGLTGGFFPNIQTSTLIKGTAALSERLMNLLNQAINDFFNTFENLIGVDIDFVVHTNKNFTIKVTSLRSFKETDLLTFAVDVTSNMIEGVINGLLGMVDVFSGINIDFYWNHVFTVEFVNGLADRPIPQMAVDISDLEGDTDNQNVEVTVIEPGKRRLTIWPFVIEDNLAQITVQSEDADQIEPGIPWQLVWLADGEPAGGDAIGRGKVRVQQ